MKRFILGLAPVLAVSAVAVTGLGMGIVLDLSLILSAVLVSLAGKHLPEVLRGPVSVIIIAGVVTIVQAAIFYLSSDMSSSFGIYLPLIAVNCYIYYAALIYSEGEALKSPGSSMTVLKAGLFIFLASISAGLVREIAGRGTLTLTLPAGGAGTLDLMKLLPQGVSISPAAVFIMPAGGFLLAGLALAFFQHIDKKRA